jgi:YggT family protein
VARFAFLARSQPTHNRVTHIGRVFAFLGLVSLILLLFQLVLVARAILDWSIVLAGPSAPGSFRSRATAGVYRITEPVLAPIRRAIPPLRVGGTAIDLSYIVLFIAIVLIRAVIA